MSGKKPELKPMVAIMSVEDARKALAKHMKAIVPHQDPSASPEAHRARREWLHGVRDESGHVVKKGLVQYQVDLDIAIGAKSNTWTTIYQSDFKDDAVEPPKQHGGIRAGGTPKKTHKERIAEYHRHLENMTKMDPESPRWKTERQGLFHQRRAMRDNHWSLDGLPPVPKMER